MGKILIIADLKGEGFATPRGLELADKLGLQAEVVAFTYAPLRRLSGSADDKADIRRKLLDDREKIVRGRIDKYRLPDQQVGLKVVWEKDIVSWINKHCAKGGYQAVVKTGHLSSSLAHTSTDWQLFRECQAPVLIVAEKKWHRTKPVLAALDLGTTVPAKKKLNDKILARAKQLAQTLGVELEIIAAIEIPKLLSDLDLVDPIAYTREAKETMQPHIRALAKAHELPEELFRCKRGPVERVITSRAAKVRAQIVVMGTVGRTGVKARLLGNTAEKVLRHLKTDVLTLKP